LLDSWPPEGLTPLWRIPIGAGYASFAIANGRAFTIEQRADREVAAAYDVGTGRELWTTSWSGAFRELMGGDGPRATPTWAGGVVYVVGGLGELRALDESTGRTLWRTNILDDARAENLQWGMASSPLVLDDSVIVLPGGSAGMSVAAYHRQTGARRWNSLDDRQAYAAPMFAEILGDRQIVIFSASRLLGISADDGRLRWSYPWTTQFDVNAAQPIVIGNNRIFVSSGYGAGAAVIELSRSADAFAVREVWRNIRMKNQFNSSVLVEGYIYGLDEGILACVDAATGDLKWKGGRYGYGQLVASVNRLIVLTEQGDLVLVEATMSKHTELARFTALEGKTWNVPAISDGILLVRNAREAAAFDVRKR
jgi:outer membrane protein assembly factor BamB